MMMADRLANIAVTAADTRLRSTSYASVKAAQQSETFFPLLFQKIFITSGVLAEFYDIPSE